MKKHVFFVLFTFITTFLIYSCSKDEHKIDTNDEPPSIDVRSGKQGYFEHTPEEIAYIHTIKSKVDAHNHFDLGADFENIKGLPDWNLAAVPYRSSGVFKSLLVPIIKGDKINAIFHVFDGSELTYYYIDESLLNEPFYCIVGPGLPLYESILDFYTNLLTNTPLDPDGDYDNTIDIPEMGGCTQITKTAVPCTDLGHMPGEYCRCGSTNFEYCDRAYWIQSTDQIDCGLNETSTTNSNYNPIQGPGPSGGGGDNNNGNNSTDPHMLLAYQYLYSVCPIISNEACIHLEFIVENVDDPIQCYLGIAMQVATLLENPSASNIAAANCYIMNTAVQQYPSAPNTCSNPFSDAPLSEFAEIYGEMNSGLVSWGSTYPGLDNIPCELTVAGYTSDEKNQILQAFKDYLGNPQGIGLGDTDPPSNPEMDKVNALNAIFSNSYYPELIDLIPVMLEWDSFDNVPDISNFLKNYTSPINQDVKNMLGLAANVSDKTFLNEILALTQGDNEEEAILATSMTFAAYNNSSIYGPYDADYHKVINPYIEADITDPTLLAIFAKYFSANCAILRKEHQKGDPDDWTDGKVYYHASKEMIHLALDLAGLVPVIGEVFDVTNGVIYAIEGDGLNASLSIAAAIPVVGWYATGGKFIVKGKWALVLKADGVVDFGRKQASKFRKALGLVPGDGKHAHHIIPWAFRESSELIQKAAKSKYAFHINEVLNGIPLPSSNHLVGHSAYSTKLEAKLDLLKGMATSDNHAYQLLKNLIEDVHELITSNPNMNLGQIAELID